METQINKDILFSKKKKYHKCKVKFHSQILEWQPNLKYLGRYTPRQKIKIKCTHKRSSRSVFNSHVITFFSN